MLKAFVTIGVLQLLTMILQVVRSAPSGWASWAPSTD